MTVEGQHVQISMLLHVVGALGDVICDTFKCEGGQAKALDVLLEKFDDCFRTCMYVNLPDNALPPTSTVKYSEVSQRPQF